VTAINTVLEIIRRVEMIVDHPGLGRPARVEGTRELVLSGLPYVVPYIHQGDTVVILRVLHGAMKWPDGF
jgi:toxin ParE1/3/4